MSRQAPDHPDLEGDLAAREAEVADLRAALAAERAARWEAEAALAAERAARRTRVTAAGGRPPGAAARGAGGGPARKLGVGLDIARSKDVEAQLSDALRRLEELNADLRLSSTLLRTIVNSIEDGLVLIDAGGQVLMANRAVTAVCRLPLEAIVGRPWYEVCTFGSALFDRSVSEGLAYRGRERIAGDGAPRSFDIQVLPVERPGAGRQVVIHMVDVTERRQFEDLAIQNERLAAAGRLAAIVAHEVNSPLQAIQNVLFLAANDDPTERDSYLGVISDEIDRIGGLIRRLLDIQRPADMATRRLDLMALIDRVLTLTSSTLARHRVHVERVAPLVPAAVVGRSDQLTQVLLNLLLNAIDAMPHGGRLRVSGQVRSRLPGDGLATGEVVEVEVADTGHGIPEDVLRHIFTPFFTTKASGSGLGLAISSRIVEQHGGRLSARNREGGGTAFTILLPAAGPEPPHESRAAHG